MTTETSATETSATETLPASRKYSFRATRKCRECGQQFTTVRHDARFCGTACRKEHSNRRAMRGAELYDLFMVLRYERGLAKAKGVWGLICRLGQEWKEEDDRANRQSWTPYQDVLASGKLTRFAYMSRVYTRAGR